MKSKDKDFIILALIIFILFEHFIPTYIGFFAIALLFLGLFLYADLYNSTLYFLKKLFKKQTKK